VHSFENIRLPYLPRVFVRSAYSIIELDAVPLGLFSAYTKRGMATALSNIDLGSTFVAAEDDKEPEGSADRASEVNPHVYICQLSCRCSATRLLQMFFLRACIPLQCTWQSIEHPQRLVYPPLG